jgi:phage gp16-like protein
MTNKKINEGVLSEEEDTGVMAKYTLYMLAKSATRLHKMVQDEEEVSQEVLDKLRAAYEIITEIKTGYDAVKSLENLPLAPTVGVTEEEALRPYKVLHVKKQPIEVKASTSYEAATKAAAIWKLKSTAGVSAYLLDTVHVAEQASSMFESARKKAKLNAKK